MSPANEDDREQVGKLAQEIQQATGENVDLAYADGGYTGEKASDAAKEHGIHLEVVKHEEAKRGFVLLPRRWVVGSRARFRVDNEVQTVGQRLRKITWHGCGIAFRSLCVFDAQPSCWTPPLKFITRSRPKATGSSNEMRKEVRSATVPMSGEPTVRAT